MLPINQTFDFVKNFGRFFYIIDHEKHNYKQSRDVPNIYFETWWYFFTLIILENLIMWYQHKPLMRVNDSITSLSHFIINQTGKLVFRTFQHFLYIYIYENYRLIDLSWNSAVTWYAAAIGVDFCYYWLHRCCHEIHILWAQHQVHHSSEEFNLTVALRQSFFQDSIGSVFYIPLAVIIPPTQYMIHENFNLLFQFWIHTEVIETIGPLEWVFNAPKHHRVHHGSNIYCLDKNYGGVLIVWDRIFGTFRDEDKNEKIIYGLVVHEPSFNPLWLQSFYTVYVFNKFRSMAHIGHKLAAIFYGPSWQPNRPRLGCDEDKIDVTGRVKFNPQIAAWTQTYLVAHFVVILFLFKHTVDSFEVLHPTAVIGLIVYILSTLTIFGFVMEKRTCGAVMELVRCAVSVALIEMFFVYVPFRKFFTIFYAFSVALYVLNISLNSNYTIKIKKMH